MFIAKLFALFPMAFFNLGFTSLCFLLHTKNLEFLGIEDQRSRLMLSELIFAVQEIFIEYPDTVVIIALGISCFTLRYVRYKWAIINTLACLTMTTEMAVGMLARMVAIICGTVFIYMHLECVRLMTRPPEPGEELPMHDIVFFLEETERMEQENNNLD